MTEQLPMEAYVAALAALDEVGPARLRWLLSLGAPAEVWARLQSGRLPATDLVPRALAGSWAGAGPDPGRLWARCRDLGVGVTCLAGPGYPPVLLHDPDPPVVLFHLGSPDVLVRPRVAVVGTRRSTPYGRQVARDLGHDLAAAGVCVVSGLALGIDAAAHRGAVAAGPAAAVVGSGLDAPCPRSNRDLCAQVAERGVVLSEAPPGTAAAPWRFPVRNRVLAGLAQAVVVVESAGAGGSMHTVREALERDVPVLAVPGPVQSAVSAGPHELLADGAGLCTGAQDVLDLLGLGRVVPLVPDPRPAPVGPGAVVLEAAAWLPTSVEVLARATDLPVVQVLAEVESLRRDGWVELAGGLVLRRARP
ncbi:MAG: DNA-processing protein DprA [Actinomycetes bacterium]